MNFLCREEVPLPLLIAVLAAEANTFNSSRFAQLLAINRPPFFSPALADLLTLAFGPKLLTPVPLFGGGVNSSPLLEGFRFSFLRVEEKSGTDWAKIEGPFLKFSESSWNLTCFLRGVSLKSRSLTSCSCSCCRPKCFIFSFDSLSAEYALYLGPLSMVMQCLSESELHVRSGETGSGASSKRG